MIQRLAWGTFLSFVTPHLLSLSLCCSLLHYDSDDLTSCSDNLTITSLMHAYKHMHKPWHPFISSSAVFPSHSACTSGTELLMLFNSNKPQAMFYEFITECDRHHEENLPLKRHDMHFHFVIHIYEYFIFCYVYEKKEVKNLFGSWSTNDISWVTVNTAERVCI